MELPSANHYGGFTTKSGVQKDRQTSQQPWHIASSGWAWIRQIADAEPQEKPMLGRDSMVKTLCYCLVHSPTVTSSTQRLFTLRKLSLL
jgi:hypothetical protein